MVLLRFACLWPGGVISVVGGGVLSAAGGPRQGEAYHGSPWSFNRPARSFYSTDWGLAGLAGPVAVPGVSGVPEASSAPTYEGNIDTMIMS